MRRRNFLQLAAAAPMFGAPRKPNVIVILADDLGFAGVGVQGCRDIPTPHIDSIAANGVRFTNGYVSCPVCSPTRAGLMTGRYQQRFGHEFNPGDEARAPANFGLPLSEVTFADRMKAAGYRTGMIGKWHLGYQPQYHPLKRGFDEFYGFLAGANLYTNQDRGNQGPILRGTEPVVERDYLTRAFGREAAAFIGRRPADPFFLYLSFNAVHAPLQASPELLEKFSAIDDPKRRIHAAMLASMDQAVGTVLDAVRARKIENDTLIFFLSDNGGPTLVNTSSNLPLRGLKGEMYEGGIRVPFMAQWKGQIPNGRMVDHPIIALDLMPTALAAAGGNPPKGIDGVNLLPLLGSERAPAPHVSLFWRMGEAGAVRKGPWKLMLRDNEPAELFHLQRDPGEQTNLAGEEPETLKDLAAEWRRWNGTVEQPLWPRPQPPPRSNRNKQ